MYREGQRPQRERFRTWWGIVGARSTHGLAHLQLVIAAALVMMAGFLFDAVRATPMRPHFPDISSKSKFTYQSNNNYTGRKYFPQPICGVGILDYDQLVGTERHIQFAQRFMF
jgi:hypothetical protein